MITLEWKEDGLTPATLITDTPLGKATIEPDPDWGGVGTRYHLYLAGAYLGHGLSYDRAKAMLIEHLATKAREIAGEPNEIPLAVTRQSLVEQMTLLAQGQYNSGAEAVFTVIEAAFREAHKVNPDMMISFDEAVSFVLVIKQEAFK